jgi:hypothetical protein
MIPFPLFQALDRQRVIRIFRDIIVYIDNNKAEDHFLKTDLIHRAQSFDEMSPRIDIRSPLANAG